MTRTKQVYISITDAAVILGVSRKTVWRYIEKEHLSAGTLPGGAIRLSRAQVLGCIKPLARDIKP